MAEAKPPTRPRRFSISLRTLMVAVLIVGGLIGWRANRARAQRRAVEVVQAAKGSIRYNWQQFPEGTPPAVVKAAKPPGPAWLRRWLGDEYFQEVTSVGFKVSVSAETMAAVGAFDRLEGLSVLTASAAPNLKIEGGLAALRGATRLKRVNLTSPSPTDADLAILGQNPDLELIRLIGGDISDAGLAHLAGLRQLRYLNLDDTPRVTDLGIEKLAQVLPGLEVLDLVGANVGDRSMVSIGKLRDLEQLGLSQTRVTDDGMAQLSGLVQLRSLWLDDTAITDRGMASLEGMTKLNLLYLKNTAVTDAGLAHLAGMTEMYELNLYGTPVTGEGFAYLEKLQKLFVLDLGSSRVSDVGMPHLARLATLNRLNLTKTNVSDQGLDQLRALPKLNSLLTGLSGVTDAGFAAFRKAKPSVKQGSNRPGPRSAPGPVEPSKETKSAGPG